MTNRSENDTPTAMEIIRDLITSGAGRSLAGQIREAFDEIEAAIAEGYSLKVITESLNAKGVKVTYKYMKNMRLRIRKERKKAKIREPTQRKHVATGMPATHASDPAGFTRNTGRTPDELY